MKKLKLIVRNYFTFLPWNVKDLYEKYWLLDYRNQTTKETYTVVNDPTKWVLLLIKQLTKLLEVYLKDNIDEYRQGETAW
jgi:hypothetical protein